MSLRHIATGDMSTLYSWFEYNGASRLCRLPHLLSLMVIVTVCVESAMPYQSRHIPIDGHGPRHTILSHVNSKSLDQDL